jgi:ribosomal protein L23
MLVTIDVGQLVRDAATLIIDKPYVSEKSCVIDALQKQLCNEVGVPALMVQIRQQVKEYKQLTMWRD